MIQDLTDGFIENFFHRYVEQTVAKSLCECNQTKAPLPKVNNFTLTTILQNLPEMLFISL